MKINPCRRTETLVTATTTAKSDYKYKSAEKKWHILTHVNCGFKLNSNYKPQHDSFLPLHRWGWQAGWLHFTTTVKKLLEESGTGNQNPNHLIMATFAFGKACQSSDRLCQTENKSTITITYKQYRQYSNKYLIIVNLHLVHLQSLYTHYYGTKICDDKGQLCSNFYFNNTNLWLLSAFRKFHTSKPQPQHC